MPTIVRRELNELEYLSWCFGQPYNMVIVTQLRGELAPEELRVALDLAQQRHPLLRVNTEVAADGRPWFCSEGVGPIPLTVADDTAPDDAAKLADAELRRRFAMDEPGPSRDPLLRVTLLRPRDPGDPLALVFTVQHIIGDGLSMVFLLRDLLRFVDDPSAPVEVLDAPARPDDLLPPRVRRRIPTTMLRFRVSLLAARLYTRLRFGAEPPPPEPRTPHDHAWTLTPEQTQRLRDRCRREQVSVQSAICTAFLPAFPAIHTPVSLRARLARPVGESFGMFVGAAQAKLRYRPSRGLWANARAFHRRLRRAMRDPFSVFYLVSKAVPRSRVEQLGPLLVRMTAGQRPFSVTNVGQLDAGGPKLRGRRLRLESFFGAVTGVVDASVLTVFTIDGHLHLRMLANETESAPSLLGDEGERAVARLLAALDE